AAGAQYAGIDHSEELLAQNRRRFPRARFLTINSDITEHFDLVASLYTIEHVVNPPAYLEKMWTFCRPQGLLAIICPDFVDGEGLPPSFYFGITPRRLRDKMRRFAFVDAACHALDLVVRARTWKSRARSAAPGAFWINLRPRILYGAAY